MSAKELNIGDYVRTKDGRITKITKTETCCKINDSDAVYVENNNDLHILLGFVIPKEMIIKSSSNIIDLIEVGDYVNGYKVLNVFDFNDNSKMLSLEKIYDNKITNEDIKSILTHEMFESMEYKIGE